MACRTLPSWPRSKPRYLAFERRRRPPTKLVPALYADYRCRRRRRPRQSLCALASAKHCDRSFGNDPFSSGDREHRFPDHVCNEIRTDHPVILIVRPYPATARAPTSMTDFARLLVLHRQTSILNIARLSPETNNTEISTCHRTNKRRCNGRMAFDTSDYYGRTGTLQCCVGRSIVSGRTDLRARIWRALYSSACYCAANTRACHLASRLEDACDQMCS